MKRKVNCGELHVEKTLLGLPHIVKAASETSPNPPVKVKLPLHVGLFNMNPAERWPQCQTSI